MAYRKQTDYCRGWTWSLVAQGEACLDAEYEGSSLVLSNAQLNVCSRDYKDMQFPPPYNGHTTIYSPTGDYELAGGDVPGSDRVMDLEEMKQRTCRQVRHQYAQLRKDNPDFDAEFEHALYESNQYYEGDYSGIRKRRKRKVA